MTAIEFNHVSKQYRLGLVSTGTLSHDLNRFWQTKILHREDPYLKIGETNDRASKGTSEYVWALRDIDFKVEQGDVVGIIGRNGAGKSTLLKLLSRVTSPTTGSIRARGRIASLLEVGTGFHPEMTGRENIYMNGSIMGMTRAEITRKLDEIVDFSGCERYLDTPVKRYSSGMSVRLGFAIAAHLEPEILVVDEVLAVGDAEFQKKAIGKMQDVAHGQGRTVLFVSHNMNAVRRLCKNGIVLKNGTVDYMGKTPECIERYLLDHAASVEKSAKVTPKHRPQQFNNPKLEIVEGGFVDDPFELSTDEPIRLFIHIKRHDQSIKKAYFAVVINDAISGYRLCDYYTKVQDLPDKDEFIVRVDCANHNFSKHRFTVNFEASHVVDGVGGCVYDMALNLLSFEIKYKSKKTNDVWADEGGLLRPDSSKVVSFVE